MAPQRAMKLFRDKSEQTPDERTPEQRDDRRSLWYSLLIHGAIVFLMVYGFSSAPSNPGPVQVELWAKGSVAEAAAPTEQEPAEPEPAEEPEVTPHEPEPEPEPQPEDRKNDV